MKRIALLSTMLLFILCSCMTYTSLTTPQTKQFKKYITTEFKQISSIKTEFSVPAIYFNISLKKESTESDMLNIFYKTRELVQKEDYQKEIFDVFFKKHFKSKDEIKYYPKIQVNFDLDNNGEYEQQFNSNYYKETNNAGKDEIDGYKTWSRWDSKNRESKPIPEPTTKPTK